jgi:hypothetical protein
VLVLVLAVAVPSKWGAGRTRWKKEGFLRAPDGEMRVKMRFLDEAEEK